MKVDLNKDELSLIFHLLNSEFYDLSYEEENDPLFKWSLSNDRLFHVKILRDKIGLYIEKGCD